MAERHRGRHASLARIDPLPVLGGKQAQIERIDIESCILENLLRNTGQSIGLGILAGAGPVVARRTDDKQHPRPRGCLLPFRVGTLQPRVGASPFDRQVVPRVSVSFACLFRDRRLSAVLVRIPRDILHARQRGLLGCEERVLERLRKAVVKLDSGQLAGSLAPPDLDLGHAQSYLSRANRVGGTMMTMSVAESKQSSSDQARWFTSR